MSYDDDDEPPRLHRHFYRPAPMQATGQHFPVELRLSAVAVPPGVETMASVQAQHPMCMHWLILDEPEKWELLDIRVGNVGQIGAGVPPYEQRPCPADLFARMFEVGLRARLDIVQLAMLLTVRARNVSKDIAELRGRWIGVELR